MKHTFEYDDTWPGDMIESHFTVDNLDAIFYFGSMFWREISPAAHETLTHEHAWFEFHCVKKGSIKIKTDKKTYVIKANEALFIPPRTYHNTNAMEESTQYVGLGFELSCNKKSTQEQLYQNLSSVFSAEDCIKLTKCLKLIDTSHELLSYANEGHSLDRCRFHNMLTTFLFQLYDKLRETNTVDSVVYNEDNDKGPDMRNYLIDYLTSNKINNITLEELSQKMYLNKKQINRIVKKRYNMTFKQKQIRFRIENAKKHLAETTLSVDQIAVLVGYTNLTSFYKAFRKLVGVTPKTYRDQILKERKTPKKKKTAENPVKN
ncbi:MAG: helix-turn-helix domain-containing protein [Ruminococcaceae bacterium]|nr:helix-turn-helix domain-containing protein [Oscillospiraceae bacterium]